MDEVVLNYFKHSIMKFKFMKPNTDFWLLDENLNVAAVRIFSIYGEMSKMKKKL